MASLDQAQRALAVAQQSPHDLGLCIRAVRLLEDVGLRAEAHSVAHAYAKRHDAGEAGGAALLALVQRADAVCFGAGEALMREGVDEDAIFVLLHGDARVRRLGVGELTQLPPGTVVGEIASLTGTARTASVYAKGPVEALRFTPAGFAELSHKLPGVYARLRETGRARLVAQLFGPTSIFGALNGLERAALFEQCLPATLAEGQEAVREGEPGHAICIIASGMAEVWRKGPDGERRVVTTLGPGSVFGELALLYDRQANATVEALTTLTLFCLDRHRFHDALARFPDARDRVVDMAQERLGVPTLGPKARLPVTQTPDS